MTDRVINGVLCNEHGDPYTPQQLTTRIIAMYNDALKHNRELERLNEQLEKWIEKRKEVSA